MPSSVGHTDQTIEDVRVRAVQNWELIGTDGSDVLADARIQLHWAAQLVAAPGNTYGIAKSDGAHTALCWDGERRLLVSEPIPAPKGFQVGLGILDLALVVFDERDRKVDEIELGGMSIDDGRLWLEDVFRTRLGRDTNFALQLPEHDLPEHSVGGGGLLRFRPTWAFDELDKLFGNAAAYLSAYANANAESGYVRTWPHHFDTAILLDLEPDREMKEEKNSIGIGFSPGDSTSSDPYWYVTPWPSPSVDALSDTISPGRWQKEGWVGAVLPIAELAKERSPAAQLRVLDRFVVAAVKECRGLLAVDSSP
ncbi:MAG: hypothetical protein HKN13_02900 [Rhodothermales bacterium]|nr:hypothetical protein [Rhodothermales bacterium]